MPRAKRIILVRHAQSMSNIDPYARREIADHKISLTDEGHAQAVGAGSKIKERIGDERVGFYVSPFLRTRQTTAGIIKAFDPYQIERLREDPQLREQEWGNFYEEDQMAHIVRERINHGIFFYRMPDGESGADVYSRSALFLDSLHRDFAKPYFPENVVIVTHGLTLRLLLMRWMHWTVEEFENTRNPHNAQFFEMNLNADNHYELTQDFPVRDPDAPKPPKSSQRNIDSDWLMR